jgi:hypothetical protein
VPWKDHDPYEPANQAAERQRMSEAKRPAGEGEGSGWRKVAAGAVALLLLACAIAFRHRLGVDFWPLDASRVGPNLIASALTWAFLLVAAVLLYPPTRRRLHRFIDQKLAPIHSHLHAQREHNEWVARHVARIHEAQTGSPADPHPHFPSIGAER